MKLAKEALKEMKETFDLALVGDLEFAKRIYERLPDSKNEFHTTLLAQLLVEELIEKRIKEKKCKPVSLRKMGFDKKLTLLEGLIGERPYFPLIRKLNQLRNNVAHNYDTEKYVKIKDTLFDEYFTLDSYNKPFPLFKDHEARKIFSDQQGIKIIAFYIIKRLIEEKLKAQMLSEPLMRLA